MSKLSNLADQLGHVQEEIAALKVIESELKGTLIESGEDKVTGEVYTATIVDVNRNQTNWKLVAEKLGPSRQLITAHSAVKSFTQVRVATKDRRAA